MIKFKKKLKNINTNEYEIKAMITKRMDKIKAQT